MNNSTANQTSALWDENHQWRGYVNVQSLINVQNEAIAFKRKVIVVNNPPSCKATLTNPK